MNIRWAIHRDIIQDAGGQPPASPTPNTDQVTEYYPFGMSISKNFTTTPANKFKYNGKLRRSRNPDPSGEEQEMPGRWLDYGARFYDAQLGRWHSVDPLAENYRRWTPYNYCVNNPMRFIDPDGMRLDKFGIDKETGKISKLNSNQYYKTSEGTVKPLPQGKSTEGKNMVDKVVNSEGQSEYFSVGSLGREQASTEEYQSFSFSAQEAESFYYFAAESSAVEWTYASTKYGGGHVGTDYNSSETQMPGYYESIYGSSLDRISHSHPGSGGGPSYDIWTKNGRAGDLNAANNSPLNVKREVYGVPNRKIWEYNKESYNQIKVGGTLNWRKKQ
jgi:RHS repeat-associated protein